MILIQNWCLPTLPHMVPTNTACSCAILVHPKPLSKHVPITMAYPKFKKMCHFIELNTPKL